MTATVTLPRSSAAPSPFPPIADYAFLSNCHTGALVAPDGSVDWLCLPSFDSPSVFGSLLDRQAGMFRFAPYGVNNPVTRSYEPGTHVLRTAWRTPTGWGVIRDGLTIYAGAGSDKVTRHTRPPTDEDADHILVRVAECVEGHMQVELICEPAFDYGRVPARWELVGDDTRHADATGSGLILRLSADIPLGIEGERVRGRKVLKAGGNFPQAFSHLALIEAAGRIILDERLEEIS